MAISLNAFTDETIKWLIQGGFDRANAFFANDPFLLSTISPESWGSLLKVVIKSGDVHLFSHLLRIRPDLVDASYLTDGRMKPIFHLTVFKNKLVFAGMLVQAGSKAAFEKGTPSYLNFTLSQNQVKFTEFLLWLHPQEEVNLTNYSDYAAPLFHADTIEMVKMLVETMQADINIVNEEEIGTPLVNAIADDHDDIVLYFLRKGADINLAGPSGVTPIHAASAVGKSGLVHQLLSRGARADVIDGKGNTPLHYAMGENLGGMDRDGDDETIERCLNISKMLVQRRCPVQVRNAKGRTAMFAICNSRWSGYSFSLINFLHQQDPTLIFVPDQKGVTPTMAFLNNTLHERDQILTFLKLLGPRVVDQLNTVDAEGKSILLNEAREVPNASPEDSKLILEEMKILLAAGATDDRIWQFVTPEQVLPTEDEVADIRYLLFFSRSLANQMLFPGSSRMAPQQIVATRDD